MDDFSKSMHLTCNQNTQNVIQTKQTEELQMNCFICKFEEYMTLWGFRS